MAFPDNSTILDNFNRSNGGLGANWTTGLDGSANALTINTNAARATSTGTFCSGYWNAATFGADVSFYIVGNNSWGSGGSKAWVYGRLQSTGTSGVDGYAAEIEALSNWGIKLYRIDNNVYTQLGSSGAGSGNFTSGDAVGLECIGSAIKAYSREGGSWSQECSATDSTYSSAGHTGLAINTTSSTNAITDIFGGTIANEVTGTAAITLPSVTVSASGTETITGTSAITLNAATVDASGAETFTGTSAVTLNAVTADVAGVETLIGTSAVTPASITVSADGTETISGSAAVTLPSVTVDASGLVANPVSGDAEVTLPAVTVDAAGDVVTVLGSGAIVLSAVTTEASGALTFSGTSAVTLSPVTIDASGVVAAPVTGAAAVTLSAIVMAANGASFTPPPISVSLRTGETGTIALRLGETGSVALRSIDFDPDGVGVLYDEGEYDEGGYGGVSFYSVSLRTGESGSVSLRDGETASVSLRAGETAAISLRTGE